MPDYRMLNTEKNLDNHITKHLQITDQELILLKKKHLSYSIETDSIRREKFFIWSSYYNFLNNETCLDFITKFDNILFNFSKKDKKNSILLNDDLRITTIIIIIKSNITKRWVFNNDLYINSNDHINYCVENFVKYCITTNIYIPEKTIKQLFLMLFSLLSENNMIESKKITLQGKKTYKTLIWYRFHTVKYTVCDEEVLNWGFNSFKLLEWDKKYYIYTIHYSRLFEICKENFFSNKSFKPKDVNYLMEKINLKMEKL